jgi:hypothetical protein
VDLVEVGADSTAPSEPAFLKRSVRHPPGAGREIHAARPAKRRSSAAIMAISVFASVRRASGVCDHQVSYSHSCSHPPWAWSASTSCSSTSGMTSGPAGATGWRPSRPQTRGHIRLLGISVNGHQPDNVPPLVRAGVLDTVQSSTS